MNIKRLNDFGTNGYQTPSITVLSLVLEQPVMTVSGDADFTGNGPEDYDIDKDVFNW
ncbi:MAG: hypothetical protein ACI3ZQ_07070 [Candidatus Cryptobacteroides sp.]